MKNPFVVLGISNRATEKEATLAFRKLSSLYHPDKKATGNKAKFQEISLAIEQIRSGAADYYRDEVIIDVQRLHPGRDFPKQAREQDVRDFEKNLFKHVNPGAIKEEVLRATQVQSRADKTLEFVVYPSISTAYKGFVCEVPLDGKVYRITLPPGIPHRLRFAVPISYEKTIIVTAVFSQCQYGVLDSNTSKIQTRTIDGKQVQVLLTKDLVLGYELSRDELRRGCTLKFDDIAGGQFTVKVPAGHNHNVPIKVQGRGYFDWDRTNSKAVRGTRGDVHLKILRTETVKATNMFF